MDNDKQIQKIQKYSIEEFRNDPQGLIKRGLKDMGITDSIPVPAENLGFTAGFITDYLFHSSHTERNVILLRAFPDRFWDSLQVQWDDVLKHADYLCDRGAPLANVLYKEPWLSLNALKVIRAMRAASILGGEFYNELNSNKDFMIKTSQVQLAELQFLGFKMLSLLPVEEQKAFLEDARQARVPGHALQLWADLCAIRPIAESEGMLKKLRTPAPMAGGLLNNVKLEIGFVEAIKWIRDLPNYDKFDLHVRNYSLVLLGMHK